MENNNLPNYNYIDLSIGNTDFSILFAPDFQVEEVDWNAHEHFHLFCECHFLISGNIRLTTHDEEYVFGADAFCVIPRNLKHGIKTITEPTRKISFYVTISQNKHVENNTFSWYEQIFLSEKPFISDKLALPFNMLFKIAQNTDSHDFIQESKLKNIFSWAFLELLQHAEEITVFGHTNTSINYDNELALKIENFLIDNFHPTTQLDDLAEHLCLSHRQTSRLLKRLFNLSFQDIKKDIRITKAKEMIHQKERSLKDIAVFLGYDSYIGFYKAFRNATGLTPEEYKDSLS